VSFVLYPVEDPVVYERLAPLSQVTFPAESFLKYLYWKDVLFGVMTDLLQVG
jgi:hypothetical protein